MMADPWDMTRAEFYRDGSWREPFARLRAEAPVYRCADSAFGPYWSVSGYDGIVDVEARPEVFSSEAGGILVSDVRSDTRHLPMFIAMDGARHRDQRRTMTPAFSAGAMAALKNGVRSRTGAVLDALPRGQAFDWVDAVATELTTGMLAQLFDMPWADRRKLALWSDWAGDVEIINDPARKEERRGHLFECTNYFRALWDARVAQGGDGGDLLSVMIHSDAMSVMEPWEFMGNLILLIVGGTDSTRGSMSGFAQGLEQFPDERAKLEADPGLIPNAVQEIIRWQTPLAHMRRTAIADTELGGQRIAKGDKVVLWYLSANRDAGVFDDGHAIRLDRANARRHLAFGHGIHRCIGARLAELQLAILLEEMAARRLRANVVGPGERIAQCFVHGFRRLPVELSRY